MEQFELRIRVQRVKIHGNMLFMSKVQTIFFLWSCVTFLKRKVIFDKYIYPREIRDKMQFPDIAIGALMMKLLIRCDQLGATAIASAIKSYDYMFKRYYECLSAKFIDFSPNNIAYAI